MASTSSNPERQYLCEVCDTCFNSRKEFLLHMKSTIHCETLKEVIHDYETCGIYIKNIPKVELGGQVLEYFSEFGQIDRCVYFKNCAQILFKEEQSATTVREMRHEFNGHELIIVPWKFFQTTTPEEAEEKEAEEEEDLRWTVDQALRKDFEFEDEVQIVRELIQVPDSTQTAEIVRLDIESTLRPLFDELSVLSFGSVFTGLAFKGSDMDYDVDPSCTISNFEQGKGDCKINRKVFLSDLTVIRVTMENSSLFSDVQLVAKAKVPIVKFVHTLTGSKCAFSIAAVGGIQNSRLIKYYMSLDPRVEQLIIVIKYWHKYFQFRQVGLSSYAVVMMALFYLMQLDRPIIPPVEFLQRKCPKRLFVDDWDCSLNLTEATQNENDEDLLNLLWGFFDFYAHFDVGMNVVCLVTGTEVPKVLFRTINTLLPAMSVYNTKLLNSDVDFLPLKVNSNICVQDPFYLNFNMTGRIETNDLFKFQTICWSSAYVIKSAMGHEYSTGILKRLLNRQIDYTWEWNHTYRNPRICISVGTYVSSPKPEFNPEEDRVVWYVSVNENIQELFKKICKFEIVDIPYFEKGVIDGDQVRLSDPSLHSFLCRSEHPNILNNRQEIATVFKNTYQRSRISCIELEEAISQHIVDKGGPVETLTFICIFRRLQKPTRMSLELQNIECTNFEEWTNFLTVNLPVWLANTMAERNRLRDE